MLSLNIIIASTRPGRIGLAIGRWFESVAQSHGKFAVKVSDLLEINLPIYNEARHPRLQEYAHQHTRDWSANVADSDAFVVVTPEYNYSTPPSLMNAFVYLHKEWTYKPLGFVSYGGVSAGTRAMEMEKNTVTALGMMPIPQAVNIPFASRMIEGEGDSRVFAAPDVQVDAARLMLDELHKWAVALKTLRSDG